MSKVLFSGASLPASKACSRCLDLILMNQRFILTAILGLLLSSCTSVTIKPVAGEHRIKEVVIQENAAVAVSDFLDVLVAGFQRHGIKARIVSESTDPGNGYVVKYVAYRHWDFKPYLTSADIYIQKDGVRIAHANYHLRNNGGLSFKKWQATETKIDPVIDQLLANVNRR